MEKDKSRGIKHIKDKRKYKGNTVKNVKYVPSKSKPDLGTNWDRYASDEEGEHDHKLSSSTDFSLLSNIPIATGSHFQFKSDKLEEDIESKKVKLFCLDLDLLHRSMLTIPFYEKLGIEKEYFKEGEIDSMDKEAQMYLSVYNEFLQSQKLSDTDVPESFQIDKSSEKVQDDTTSVSYSVKEDDVLELINNCNIQESSKGIAATDSKIKVGKNSSQDLEQWLEDILED